MDMRLLPRLCLLMLLLASCSTPAVTAPPPAPSATIAPPTTTATPIPSEFRIVAYATDAIVESIIPYAKLTHINYSFLTPKEDGTFNPIPNSFKLKNIVGMARQFDVKVLVAVGGWSWDAQFETVAADPKLRSAFVQNLKAVVDEFQLDGLDMDWEYPDEGQSAQNFLALMQELRVAMPDKVISMAVVSYGENGNGILPETFELVDFVNVMTMVGPPHVEPYATNASLLGAGKNLVDSLDVSGDGDALRRIDGCDDCALG